MTNRYFVPFPTGVGYSAPRPTNHRANPFNLALSVQLGGGTATYTIEHTYDDVQAKGYDPLAASSKWYATTGLTALSADAEAQITFPVSAYRINCTAGSAPAGKVLSIQTGW